MGGPVECLQGGWDIVVGIAEWNVVDVEKKYSDSRIAWRGMREPTWVERTFRLEERERGLRQSMNRSALTTRKLAENKRKYGEWKGSLSPWSSYTVNGWTHIGCATQ